ncbi:MAG: hypothetical protein ABIV48_01525 [Pyrinomonadaceae bacterium]
MKRCPECRRDYYDDTLRFCLEDGTLLVYGVPEDEPATAILSRSEGKASGFSSGEAMTEILSTYRMASAETVNSIAVLPFANLSADVENEYFCDGLAEELLNALAKIDDLKVAARTSAFAFKGKNTNIGEIARTLGVRTVLEGSVRKSGDRLRITVQIINAADGYHVWSERYDREMKDIFEVQDEITLAVVDALKLKLFGEKKEAVLKRYTNDAEAYQLYLQGRFFFYKRTPEGFHKAVECFEKAIELDSEYALAVSGLADCYTFFGFYEALAPSEAKLKAGNLAFRALELDDTLSEAETSVAFYYVIYEWDFATAEKHFWKARELNPKYALTYHLHSSNLLLLGRINEAIEAEKHAVELEPFALIFSGALAWWYYLARRNEEAIAQALKTIEMGPNHFFAYWALGSAYAMETSYTEAIAILQEGIKISGFGPHIKGELGRVFALAGLVEEAREVLAALQEQLKTEYISAVNIAKIYAGLGENELFFEWLERAYLERSVRLPWFMIDPYLDDYRSDPRFQQILSSMGLPERDE